MQMLTRLACLIALGTTMLPAASPLNGTWKLNLEKSKLSGQTYAIQKKMAGMYRFESQGFAYDFDLSGKEFPTPDGGTTSWHAPDANTWDGTNRMNGKVVSMMHITLSGNSLTTTMKMTKADGAGVEQTSVDTRVSGGPGFAGKWKSGDVKGAPTTLEILTDGENRISILYPDYQGSCTGAFDGTGHVLKTAGADTKMLVFFEKNGPNGVRMTTKLNGKPFYTDVLTVSADGKTLTDDGNAVSVNEPTKAVYEKQ